MLVRVLVVLGLLLGGGALLSGLGYYVVPLAERPFSPLAELYAPTGLIGQGFGIIGTAMILGGVLMYSLRKRVRWLSRVGQLGNWLHVHIFLCLVGPFLVLLHTTFKFGGLVSISFWSMTLVVASGVFGRWVYTWIPKTMNGHFLAHEEVRGRMRGTLEDVEEDGILTAEQIEELRWVAVRNPVASDGPGLRGPRGSEHVPGGVDRRRQNRKSIGIWAALRESLRFRLGRSRARARLKSRLYELGVTGAPAVMVVRRIEEAWAIEQQLRLLEPFRRALRYWHAFHLPLAGLMFLILIVHVGVAVAFGYTWIF